MKEFSDNSDASIDKLFKDTFGKLPNDASASGWDMPSEKVWQHIEAGKKAQPKGGNSGSFFGNWVWMTGGLLIGMAVAGLVWFAKSPSSQQPKQVTPATKSVPAATIPAVLPDNAQDPSPAVTPSSTTETPTIAKPLETKAKKVGNKKAKNRTEAEPVQYNTESATESKKEYPNNLERLKSKKLED